ncbi:response regulator [Kutzneria kofuensis]|uniref:DNA-binding response OmpR family regulator n=1 Tax=Kutzneria kofuensis TaxID=103725 RepID=A0A7W9KK61_9PSEU|nr:response regulator [Kutzneria kofuensis]MBB5893808.1 DNA-binding response OmpR family regulator [Kutzneria kofuensis]
MDGLTTDETSGIRVRILGRPTIFRADGSSLELTPLHGSLLAALALAGPRGRSKLWLMNHLWTTGTDPNALSQAALRLRKHAPVPKPAAGAPYVLDLPTSSIDALVFRDSVLSLSATEPTERFDELLQMWDSNPWEEYSRLPASCWRDIKEARDRLVTRVRGLTDPERASLSSWNGFCDIFHTEAARWRGEPQRPVVKRKRVLIVDDLIAKSLEDVLRGEFECDLITSIGEWTRRLAAGHPLDHDCALVDLHLDEGMVDGHGRLVLEDLRRLRPEMPTALMSAELPFEDLESLKRSLGVRNVIPKHNDQKGPMIPLRDLVRKLIADG